MTPDLQICHRGTGPWNWRSRFTILLRGSSSAVAAVSELSSSAPQFSVSHNITEGFAGGTNNELLSFLYIAPGSAGKVRSLLRLLERRRALRELHSAKTLKTKKQKVASVNSKPGPNQFRIPITRASGRLIKRPSSRIKQSWRAKNS